MKLLAPALEQGTIGGVLNERMLEAVARVRRHPLCKDQLRLCQPTQGILQFVVVQRRHSGEEFVIELAANDGTHLQYFLDASESVEPGHERVAQGRRDRQRR